ncbi:U-scoloptoxin(01)-Cw1a-like [Penaeus indicus]|uniref:U-scoloptoxin(01)-Cw1a-like n=1 Tax=Penaeus indicus TaxID=29960 RepID=UPI00300D178B
MKVLAALLALAGVAAANSAYRFSDGYLDVLGAEPVQNFDCSGRAYGYYADVSSDCRVFHVCLPVADDLGELLETAQFSFFCGNQTVFSQESLTCAHSEEAFPCDQAETLFDVSNAGFGIIPEDVK